jgi:hypothetical protein
MINNNIYKNLDNVLQININVLDELNLELYCELIDNLYNTSEDRELRIVFNFVVE